MDIQLSVVNQDALEMEADVLVLKYAQAAYGVDREVINRLARFSKDLPDKLPLPDACLLVPTFGCIGAKYVLFVGVESLLTFSYGTIRGFSRAALEFLSLKSLNVQTLCFTLHGTGFGLDEREAFESEIAGWIDAFSENLYPKNLSKIVVAEFMEARARRLEEIIKFLFPKGKIVVDDHKSTQLDYGVFINAGNVSENKPLIFVAMPFSSNMYDVFDYGIRGAVKKAGFLCERTDEAFFTGEIMERIKKRIQVAELIIADMTTSNPNVYLEVGLAWGFGKPTILIAQNEQELKFDVQGHKCIYYSLITDLEAKLTSELIGIKGSNLKG
jgi:hypothetical protein